MRQNAPQVNGRQLRNYFEEFNQLYFRGRLQGYAIRVVPRMTSRGESGRCKYRRKLIEIQRGHSYEESVGILLHEMAHAVTDGNHGKRWRSEMIRLREQGAPLCSAELRITLDDWSGQRVSKQRFRDVAQDALIGSPCLTLAKFIRYFIREVGGPPTAKEFLQRYPWARAEFKRLNRERDEAEKQKLAVTAALERIRAA